MDATKKSRLFIKIQRYNLPQVKDRYPYIYLERGRMEIDDSSVKWIDADGNLVRIPAALLNAVLLGPGTSITHEAVKVLAASNCMVCWVGEDSMLFYAVGHTPTSNTRNMKFQMTLACSPKRRVEVAKRMFGNRFPGEDIGDRSLQELIGMEGRRVRRIYAEKAAQYGIGWKGRSYTPGKFELGDMTNKILTATNAALYGILTSAIYSMGFSPHVGFIHSGSPLPFVYDIADLYKEHLCIDLAFGLTLEMAGSYNKYVVAEHFRQRVIATKLLDAVGQDIKKILGMK